MSVNLFRRFFEGINLKSKTGSTATGSGDLEVVGARLKFFGTANEDIVTNASTDILTNKTVVVSNNTITTAASGNLIATELNAALSELQGDIDGRALDSNFTSHTGSTTAHGATGAVVGTTNSQALSNKTIDADLNTISNLKVSELKAGVLDTDLTAVSLLDDTLPSAKATKTYADNLGLVKQNKFNGLEDASLFTVSYVPATRIFTVTCAGGAAAFVNGVKYLCATQSTTAHANTTGKWYLYYDATGTLVVSSTVWVLSQSAPVALVYYNATNVASVLFNEKHAGPTGMDDATHSYLHSTRGTQVLSGFAISGYTLNTAGVSNLSYAIDSGSLADEDLITNVVAVADGGPYRVMSRTGASGNWTWSDTSISGILDNGTNLYYNQFTGGAWQLTPITSNSTWVNYYILSVPTADGSAGSVIMMGQSTFGSLASAQAEEPSTAISGFSNFTTEGVFIARMTYRRVSGSSPANAQLASVQPIRTNSISVTSGFTPTDHQSLSNRSAIGSHPASAISNLPSGNLVATDVQTALDELQTDIDSRASLTGVETFSNKSLIDSTTSIIDVVDPTKIVKFDVAGTTGTSTTITSSQTVNRVLTLPDETDILATQTNAKSQAIKYSLIF